MNIKQLSFFTLAAAALSFTACSEQNEFDEYSANAVQLTATIEQPQTRLDAWSGSEQVGVFMLDATKTGTDAVLSTAKNVAYKTAADGSLSPVSAVLNYPGDKSVQFCAYYPYSASLTGENYAINLGNSSVDADLLYAKTTEAVDASNKAAVALTFKHQLSMLTLKVQSAPASLDGATIAVTSKSKTTFNLATGTLATPAADEATREMAMTTSASLATGKLIVLPGKTVSAAKITIAGKTYAVDASQIETAAGQDAQYNVTIAQDGTVTVKLATTIEGWDVNNGTGVATPTDGGDTGNTDPEPFDYISSTTTPIATAVAGATQAGQDFTCKGVVVAMNTNSYILRDNSGIIYVYASTTPTLQLGDIAEVSGPVKTYFDLVEYYKPTYTTDGTYKVAHPEAKTYEAPQMDSYVNNIVTEFVTYTGTLTKDGDYYQVTLPGTDVKGSLRKPLDGAIPSSLVDKQVIVKGYTIGTNSGKNYVYTLMSSIEAVDGGDTGGDTGNTGGDTGNTGGDTGATPTDPNDSAIPYASFYDCPAFTAASGATVQSGNETFGSTKYYKIKVNNTQTYVAHTTREDGQVQRNYEFLFDNTKKVALWLAYPMHGNKWGDNNSGRTNSWNYDPAIETQYQPNLKSSYKGSYDRGHQMASSDRQNSRDANKQTFYFTNMTPQVASLNQGEWVQLEQYVQNHTRSMTGQDTVYVVTGPIFERNIGTTTDKSGKACPLPTGYYKTIVKAHFSSKGVVSKVEGCAFYFPTSGWSSWESSKTTIDDIESKTGFDFYTNFPDELIEAAENTDSYYFL